MLSKYRAVDISNYRTFDINTSGATTVTSPLYSFRAPKSLPILTSSNLGVKAVEDLKPPPIPGFPVRSNLYIFVWWSQLRRTFHTLWRSDVQRPGVSRDSGPPRTHVVLHLRQLVISLFQRRSTPEFGVRAVVGNRPYP